MANLSIIRPLCKSKGMTLKTLSKELNISEPGLQRMLRTNTTKIETLEKIADVLGVNIIEFFYPQGLIPNNDDIIFTSFVKDSVSAILCKRYKKFSEKLSYYMDNFLLNIFPPENYYRDKNDISIKLRYPFKHISKPKYVFKRKDKSVYPKIPNNIRELPFSLWPEEYQKQIKENNFLLESFYFPVFYFNLLNIVDYLNEGILEDKELIQYWEQWQKVEKEAKIVSLPLYIDVYEDKPVYPEED